MRSLFRNKLISIFWSGVTLLPDTKMCHVAMCAVSEKCKPHVASATQANQHPTSNIQFRCVAYAIIALNKIKEFCSQLKRKNKNYMNKCVYVIAGSLPKRIVAIVVFVIWQRREHTFSQSWSFFFMCSVSVALCMSFTRATSLHSYRIALHGRTKQNKKNGELCFEYVFSWLFHSFRHRPVTGGPVVTVPIGPW